MPCRNHSGCFSASAFGATVNGVGCPPPIPGDFQGDGDVDPAEFAHWHGCLSGPAEPQNDPACRDSDFDDDGDVDLEDFGVLQRCLSGTDLPANPACGG